MNIILLCGGSGKRLWPLSNDVRSKQFLELFKKEDGGYESMLQRIYRQIKAADPEARILFATSGSQVSAIRNQIGEDVLISPEPDRRDTFPAIALAAEYLFDVRGVPMDEPILICPVDGFVGMEYYEMLQAMEEVIKKGSANLVLMGATPQSPSTQYGYILSDENGRVRKFTEKPSKELAEKLIKDGALWNCGVAAVQLGYLLSVSHRRIRYTDYQDLLDRYVEVPAVSFEKAVVEKERNAAVTEYSQSWKKLDTWESLIGEMTEQNIGNVHTDETCGDVHVINELDLPIICMGLDNVIVSASPEGILVSDRKCSGNLKPIVDGLSSEQVMIADKAWGTFQVLDVQKESMTVRVVVRPGMRMNYHSHERRDEVWTIVSGTGRTIVDGMEQPVQSGDVITMQAGCRHTIIADTELKIIEVQLGKEISVNDKRVYELEI